MRREIGPSLETLREQALARVDREAEQARLRHITPGAGQAMEYAASLAEARALLADGEASREAWPWLEADRQATGAASLVLMAQSIVAANDAWTQAGAAIRELRRSAKISLREAGSVAAIHAVFPIPWP